MVLIEYHTRINGELYIIKWNIGSYVFVLLL